MIVIFIIIIIIIIMFASLSGFTQNAIPNHACSMTHHVASIVARACFKLKVKRTARLWPIVSHNMCTPSRFQLAVLLQNLDTTFHSCAVAANLGHFRVSFPVSFAASKCGLCFHLCFVLYRRASSKDRQNKPHYHFRYFRVPS